MIRIGAASINGKENPYSFCFDRRINLDWKKYHDTHITEKILELVRPFGIETKDMRLQIDFTDEDIKSAVGFISKFECEKETLIIGLSLDSINSSSLWSLDNFASLIERINSRFKANFYIIENIDEKKLTGIVLSKLSFEIFTFNDRNVSKMAALIAQTDLFITNNSRIMHIAGSTGTPMIVIFGQTNPYSILPFGENKYFLRKSDLIDDVTVDDAFSLCCKVLESNKKLKQNLT
jgi:heptosyltransferase-2